MGSMVDYTSLLNLHGNDPDGAHLQSHLDVDNSHPVHPDQIQLHHPGDNILEEAQRLVQEHNRGQVHMLQHDMAEDATLHQGYVGQVAIQKTCSKCKETKVATEFFKDKSKPDGMYSQCKTCATIEERRRRESRPQPGPEMQKTSKKCTRCGLEKPANAFCRNKRSFDGLYSQCRTCVSDKDKDRRQKMLMQKPEPVPNKLCSRCNTHKTCEEFYRDASKPDGLQTYCKPCLCAKHKELRDRKRMRGIQDHLNSTGQLHLVDPAHLADPNEDPYAGHQSYPVYNLDGSLQGHVTVADGVDLDAAGLQAVYADGVAQGYPIDGVDEGQGGEQQYVLQQPEYDEQQGYHAEEGYAHVSEQQTDEQGYLAQQEGEQGYQEGEQVYQEGEYIQGGASQDYVHDAADGYQLAHPQSFDVHPDDAQQVYAEGGHVQSYDQQHDDTGAAHHGYNDSILHYSNASVHGGGYEEQRARKRYRIIAS
ncbi:g8444 [Coccomyxa elongata]